MAMAQEPPLIAEGHSDAAEVQACSEGMEKNKPLSSQLGEVLLTLSRQSTCASISTQSTCDTCADGMDMEECLRNIFQLEIELAKTKKREHDIMQKIDDAKVLILDKGKEVCNLQGQILEELRERQELARKVLERDFEILCLQESGGGSQARSLDVDKWSASKIAAESCCGSKVGSSNVASGVRVMPASNSLPTLPKQDMMVSREQLPRQRSVRKLAVGPPSSPQSPQFLCRGSPVLSQRASLPPQFKLHEKQVPSWAAPCTQAMGQHVVMQNLQVQNASRPMSYR
jgi:hypothetical protein